MESHTIETARELVKSAHTIAIFTGAGMSAESGVPTFRDAISGLWSRYDPEQLASISAWKKDKSLVWAWYISRFAFLDTVSPNLGHYSVAKLAQQKFVPVITQNIDNLHERAGSSVVYHLHGNAAEFFCDTCGLKSSVFPEDLRRSIEDAKEYIRCNPETSRLEPPRCICSKGHIRPAIVWFGENLPSREWEMAKDHISHCDLLVVVGTSGIVYPAAELPLIAHMLNIPIIECNITDTPLSHLATVQLVAGSAEILPQIFTD